MIYKRPKPKASIIRDKDTVEPGESERPDVDTMQRTNTCVHF